MKVAELRKKAKPLGIKAYKMNKVELVHAIQKAEGYTVCFGGSDGQCPHTDCCFREDCLKITCRVV
ncbi:MAG: Rho termination factor N-terminal domain-containing protein [Planctomycetota bacterium]|jgi:hypothetical protein